MNEQFRPKEILRAETLSITPDESIALVALNGINRSTINHESTTTYEVIAGQGVMFVDYSMHALEPGAKITVPKGIPTYDAGENVVMWATSRPPFNPKSVEEIK